MSDKEPQSPTWKTEAVANMGKAKAVAISKLHQAPGISDFILWTNAVRRLGPQTIDSWDQKDVEGASAESWLVSYTGDSDKEKSKKLARVASDLLKNITSQQESDQARVILKKTPGFAGSFDYYALGVFPGGVIYDVDRLKPPGKDVVFMKFGSACNSQALDLLTGKAENAAFSTEDSDKATLYEELGFDVTKSRQQNFKYRDENGNVTGTRDAQKYILYALKGGFSNEDDRYLLSDFPEKLNEQQNNKSL